MRFSQTPSLSSLLLIALSTFESVQAWPLGEIDFAAFLVGRSTCASFCGADSQFCCTSGQSCTTLAGNVATCVSGGSVAVATGGGYAVYTTTYTETDLALRTSTYSSYWQAATTSSYAAAPTDVVAVCTTSLGQTSCGTICCASDQICASAGQCAPRTSSWTYTASSTFSAPLRPTSGGVSTATAPLSVTTTQPFIPPATASGSTLPLAVASNKGLSAGAIAGIVIGVIAGVLLLLLICFCCIAKAGFDSLLALFGLGKRRNRGTTERTEIIEERYSRHGSGAASRRQTHTGWFGGSRPTRVTETRKKSSGLGGLGIVGAALIGLAVMLGLKRKANQREKPSNAGRSDISSSYSSDDWYTNSSPSSASSEDRTTHITRQSRQSRQSKH